MKFAMLHKKLQTQSIIGEEEEEMVVSEISQL
jgi:hypothetical protein